MDINKTNAIKLWDKQFGSVNKTFDYSGREIAKSAYGDKNSKYCWSIDHILPKSQGGTNEERNLMCCHMETNVDKANKFPVFQANGKIFQIVKKGNQWVIEEVSKPRKPKTNSMANEVWKREFGDSVEGYDFAGRRIQKNHLDNKNSEYGWSIASVVDSKEMDYDNVYIGNLETIGDQSGKTIFRTNDKQYIVRKMDSGYTFTCSDAIEDAFDPVSIKSFVKALEIENKGICVDYIIVKVEQTLGNPLDLVFRNGNSMQNQKNFCNLVRLFKEILKTSDVEYETEIVSDGYNGSQLIVFKCKAETKDKVTKVFDNAILINTYREFINSTFGTGITIFNALVHHENAAYKYEYDFAKACRDFLNEINRSDHQSSLYINSLANQNLTKDKLQNFNTYKYFNAHNLVYTELSKKLKKL